MLVFIVPFCSLFILVGGWLTVSSVRKIVLSITAQRWPTTTGRLTSVENKISRDSESSSREIVVTYSYTINGQTYEGNVIHPSYTNSSVEEANNQLEAKLSPGKAVEVYYNPANPKRSMLSTGFYSISLAVVFGGLIFLGAGLGFLGTFWFAITGKTNFADGIKILP